MILRRLFWFSIWRSFFTFRPFGTISSGLMYLVEGLKRHSLVRPKHFIKLPVVSRVGASLGSLEVAEALKSAMVKSILA